MEFTKIQVEQNYLYFVTTQIYNYNYNYYKQFKFITNLIEFSKMSDLGTCDHVMSTVIEFLIEIPINYLYLYAITE